MTQPRPRRTTARRIAAAFGLVLLLFALALVVMITTISRRPPRADAATALPTPARAHLLR